MRCRRVKARSLKAIRIPMLKSLPWMNSLALAVDEDRLVERIVGRFTCAACGTGHHDSYKQPKTARTCDVCGGHMFKRGPRTRMAEYHAKTQPILPHFEAKGLVGRINGMAAIADVGAAIDKVLDAAAQ